MNDIDKIAELEHALWDAAAALPLGSKELETASRKASRVGLAADLAIDAERRGRVVDFRAVMHTQEGHPRLGAREWWEIGRWTPLSRRWNWLRWWRMTSLIAGPLGSGWRLA